MLEILTSSVFYFGISSYGNGWRWSALFGGGRLGALGALSGAVERRCWAGCSRSVSVTPAEAARSGSARRQSWLRHGANQVSNRFGNLSIRRRNTCARTFVTNTTSTQIRSNSSSNAFYQPLKIALRQQSKGTRKGEKIRRDEKISRFKLLRNFSYNKVFGSTTL